MTPDLARLRALIAEATPGPWYARGDNVVDDADQECAGIIATVTCEPHEPDAILITEMRNQLPALLDELERLRAVVRSIEWTHCVSAYGRDCVSCGNQEEMGHAPDCELGAAIGNSTPGP